MITLRYLKTKLTVLFVLCILFSGLSQKMKGNYLGISQWSVLHLQLKANGKVKRYTNGCTDRGTITVGTWQQSHDTIRLKFNQQVITYLYREKTLCYINGVGQVTDIKDGLHATRIKSKSGILRKAKHVRKMQRRRIMANLN